ncbi:MAG: helix-turn-helix domain-containing protein, partial [Pseudomonadota bacterium]
LYRNSDLTLSALAEATGLSGHHVSEVLNQHAGKNFYEFINGYRVEYVQNRLRERQDAKVLDIAMEAGFASKSTFNAVFKQSTGQTPTQFRRTLTPTNV